MGGDSREEHWSVSALSLCKQNCGVAVIGDDTLQLERGVKYDFNLCDVNLMFCFESVPGI